MLQSFVPTIFLVRACGDGTFIPELRALYMSRSDQNRMSVGNFHLVLMAIVGYQAQTSSKTIIPLFGRLPVSGKEQHYGE